MTYLLADLPFEYEALEPYMDAETLHFHHDKHHNTYVTNLNLAIEKHPEIGKQSIEEVLKNLAAVPEDIRTAVRNNGGGHANHTFFWESLAPNAGVPLGAVQDDIEATFGSFEAFQDEFKAAATGRFGSGWAWLVITKNGDLAITSTANQDTPLSDGQTPLLTLDVWEHAYYLKYRNVRPDYVAGFWHIVNWEKVNERYLAAQ